MTHRLLVNYKLPAKVVGMAIVASSVFYVGCASTENTPTVTDISVSNPYAPTDPNLT